MPEPACFDVISLKSYRSYPSLKAVARSRGTTSSRRPRYGFPAGSPFWPAHRFRAPDNTPTGATAAENSGMIHTGMKTLASHGRASTQVGFMIAEQRSQESLCATSN